MKFSNQVELILKSAGWHEGRNVLNKLKLPYDDYPSIAIKFLARFARLKGSCITMPFTATQVNFSIDPEVNLQDLLNDDTFSYYSNIIGSKLFPIGHTDSGNGYEICCDNDGNLYELGEYCFFVGNSLYQGIENVISQNTRDFLQLDEDTGRWWNVEGEEVQLPY